MYGPANAASKIAWRAHLSTARRELPQGLREAEASALASAAVRDLHPTSGDTICCYVPMRSEPGSLELVERLRGAGARVLLPVTAPGRPLDWSEYTSARALRRGTLGVDEPVGPRLGSAAVLRASALLVPALAVDRRGFRLGRGGGYYDRTLALLTTGTPVIAIVRDVEIVDKLPSEPHDRPVTAALTPGLGLVPLAGG